MPAPMGAAALLGIAGVLLAMGESRAAFVEVAGSWGVADGDSMSYAAGFLDFDGDGDLDFTVNNHWKGPAELLRNDGGAPLVSHSSHYGTGNSDRHEGGLWADLDNDGDPDEYILHPRNQNNELFWNQGQGVFVEGAIAAGVNDFDGRGRELAVADFNGDHLLDLWLVNAYRAGFVRPNRLFWNNGDGTFTMQPNVGVMFEARLHTAAADYDQDGRVDIVSTSPSFQPGEFWRNNGNGTFTNVTASVFPGITLPLEQGQGLTWADYDDDGWLDLLATGGNRAVWETIALEADSLRFYVEPDTGQTRTIVIVTDGDSVTVNGVRGDYSTLNLYYGSSGAFTTTFPATFALDQLDGVPAPLTVTRALYLWRTAGAGADSVTLVAGGAGGTSLFEVGGSLRASGGGILSWNTLPLLPPPPYVGDDWSNRLYHNEGDGTFTEVTATAFAVNDGVSNTKGAAWGDYDNDGRLDVYMCNGGTVDTGNLPNWLFRNNGDGTFTEVAAAEGVQGTTRGMSDGASWGDLNEDGFLDLFVANGAEHPPIGVGPRELFLNTPNGNHWIRVQLRGLVSNGSGIGARLRFVSASGTRWRYRLGESEEGFAGDPAIHCGLGADAVIDTLQIIWPSGQVDTFEQVQPDLGYFAIEGKPLREMADPHFIVLSGGIQDTLDVDETRQYSVAVDNFGGLAADVTATLEDCATGLPIGWLALDPSSTTVWPGGAPPFTLTADATGLAEGAYCGRVVFESNSFLGPDTLLVDIEVSDLPVGADVVPALPSAFALSPPRPNPARFFSAFELALPERRVVEARIHDVGGRCVRTLLREARAAGWHRIVWDRADASGRAVAPGVYLLQVTAGADRVSRKVVILD
jgi:hypothetical protein